VVSNLKQGWKRKTGKGENTILKPNTSDLKKANEES